MKRSLESESEPPGGPAAELNLDTRVGLLNAFFKKAPPKPSPDGEQTLDHICWGTLCEINENIGILSDAQIRDLSELGWFGDFLEDALSQKCSRFFYPTHDEVVGLLIQHFTRSMPTEEDKPVITFRAGRPFLFKGSDALRSLEGAWNKRAGLSLSAKRALLDLPWARDWEREHAKPAPRAVRVSTAAKVALTLIFYPENAPAWRDEIPVGVEDDVWLFKPVQWLDDVCEAWMCDNSNVRISLEDMGRLEGLPWFTPWIDNLKAKRYRRMAREKSATEPSQSDGGASGKRRAELIQSFIGRD